jgi:RHS repeat-associated protein
MHVDHLNTPRLVADAAGTTVWRWDQQEPFGNNPADENPSGLGAFDLPLRLPGQRYDTETGLHYNYFRDYDPSLGIYKQSDPIGLRGGINTYAYVVGNPLSGSDPTGRFLPALAAAWPYVQSALLIGTSATLGTAVVIAPSQGQALEAATNARNKARQAYFECYRKYLNDQCCQFEKNLLADTQKLLDLVAQDVIDSMFDLYATGLGIPNLLLDLQ